MSGEDLLGQPAPWQQELLEERGAVLPSPTTASQDWWRESLSPKHLALPLLAVVIILTNSFLIAIIATNPRLRNVPGMFLISIAIADLMTGFPTIPLHVAAELNTKKPSWFCLVAMSFSAFQLLVIVLTLFVHIIERYAYLAHPLKHKKYATRRNALALIVIVWVYSFSFGCLPLLGWNAMDTYSIYHGNGTLTNRTASQIDEQLEEVLSLSSCRFDVILRGSYLGVLFYMHMAPVIIIVPACYVHILCQARTVLKRREPSVRAAITTFTFVGSARARLLSSRSISTSDSGHNAPRLSINGSPVTINGSHVTDAARPFAIHSAPLHRRFSSTLPNIGGGGSPPRVNLSPPHIAPRVLSNNGFPATTAGPSSRSTSTVDLRASHLSITSQEAGPRALRIHHRPHLRPFILLFVVLLCFILSWFPTMIWHAILFRGFTKEYVTDWEFVQHPLPISFYYAGAIFGVVNSVLNPVLFGLGNPQVRQALIRVVCFCRQKKNTYRLTRV